MPRLLLLTLLVIVVIADACPAVTSDEPVRCEGHTKAVGAVALSLDGKLAVSYGDNYIVRVWNANDGTEIRTLQVVPPDAKYGYISAIAISPDSKRVATAAWRQPICFWDPATGERQVETLPVTQAAYSLAFSPDGSKLAVAEQAEVKIWDLHSYKVLHDFRFDQRAIGAAWRITFSPDGRLLAAALRDYGGSFVPKAPKVRVWNVATGEEVFSAWSNDSAVAVAFSPDGKLLAAAGMIVEIWDVKTQQSLHSITTNDRPVYCLAFVPDGKTIATGGSDPGIKLWDVATGKLAATLKGHTDQVHDLCVSYDGTMLASAGKDRLLLVWKLSQLTVKVDPQH